jgi:hypothetical protein
MKVLLLYDYPPSPAGLAKLVGCDVLLRRPVRRAKTNTFF